MKNSANALAPRAVCWVASSGITGGFSPGLVFGPVLGTSAGTLGVGGAGGPPGVDDDGVGGAEVVGGGTETVGRSAVDGAVDGAVPPDDVHATQPSMTNAANVQIRPTTEMMPHPPNIGIANRSDLWKTGTVGGVTRLGPPGTSAGPIEVVTDADRAAVDRLIAADPYVNVVLASRLAAHRTLDALRLGGEVLAIRDGRDGELRAAAFNGGNLLPIGGETEDWLALAVRLAQRPRRGTSIVGRADAVATMWAQLEPAWGRARAIRAGQPLLMIGRGEVRAAADQRVRVMRPQDVERYLPAAAAMFTEELGISPFAQNTGFAYRRRVESLLSTGRAFGIVDEDGRIAFKADVGALSAQTCQLQGVWVRPDLRGQGLGTAALAGVLHFGLRLAPTVSLYVNDFNAAARRVYAKLGMKQVARLSTVLF